MGGPPRRAATHPTKQPALFPLYWVMVGGKEQFLRKSEAIGKLGLRKGALHGKVMTEDFYLRDITPEERRGIEDAARILSGTI